MPTDPPASSRPPLPSPPVRTSHTTQPAAGTDAMACDRCGAGMFRMHAVWRCPACGYKTDCCGW